MRTVTNEIEIILNSRPLAVLHDDDIEEPLNPNHLLHVRQSHFNNYNDSIEDEVFDAHKRIEYLETYLITFGIDGIMNTYHDCLSIKKYINDRIGSYRWLVICVNIYDSKMPRHKWLLGHIYDVTTGKDGTVRGRKLFVGKTKKNC